MSNRRGASLALRIILVVACALSLCLAAYAQSTFGSVQGTVKDPSGSIVPGAKLELVNTGTNAVRTATSGSGGNYQFSNIDVGNYKLRVDAPGFQKAEYQAFDLAGRETKHIDVDLQVASQAATVTVEAIATIQTDISNVSETKGALELTDLPVAIYTRSQGSTSAFSTLTAQPGVQTDANNNLVVAGALPSQQSFSIDGISSIGPGTLSALSEMFPSFNAIEEIKISETLNPAEYGGVADITTISKSGTNSFHGGLFENVQNTEFNAADTFSHEVSPVKLNNFGAYIGGPVIIPHLYNGRNRTFFFVSGEVLRLPKSQTVILSTPTAAMRGIGTPNGEADLSAYSDPLTGYPGNKIPAAQLNPFAQKYLSLFYPLPNYGPPGAIVNNYLATYATPINSAQGDIRLDQNISPKHLVYARYTYKNRRLTNFPEDGDANPGSPFPGSTSLPEIYKSFAAAYNWVISPSLVNELRGGFSTIHRGFVSALTAQHAADLLGLTNLPGPPPPGYSFPAVTLAGFLGAYPVQTIDITPSEGTYQGLDTLTWTKSKHTMKFGGDFRYLSTLFTNVFADFRMGTYQFNGASNAVTSLLGTGAGVPMAQFLLGYPDSTTTATVINPATDAYSKHYAFFGQDDWKVTQRLTINFGLRWEYHPAFQDKNNDVVNWYPNYTSTVNGQVLHGAVILPNQAAFANINPQFTESLLNTPEILASSVGVPKGLRNSDKTDFAPRIGFAYRLDNSGKTVLRGGYGRFIETLLSASAINGWSVGASDVSTFTNDNLVNGKPQFQLPYSFPSNIAQPGSYYFDLASDIKFRDPIVEEWNLTLERDLGKGIGVRGSYDGNHSYNVPTLYNNNQVHPNTLGLGDPSIQAQVPFPQLLFFQTASSQGFGNYQAGTVSVHKRSSSLQFEGSYTFTRNLSNLQGYGHSRSFTNEFGNQLSDPFNAGLDYGNTPFSRRNRFLATFLYELPFGKGKYLLNNVNPVLEKIVGGFVLSGVALFQSGPFLTISTFNDPSGTGFNNLFSTGGRADTVPGANPYQGQSIQQWINPNAFAEPNNNIGRFGDAQNGSVQGPSTKAVSISLLKRFPIAESVRLEIGAQISNIFNHPNYAPPGTGALNTSVPQDFGQITALQSAEGAGPRQIQLTGRFTF